MKIRKSFWYFTLLTVSVMVGILVLNSKATMSVIYQSREEPVTKSERLQIIAVVEKDARDGFLILKFSLKNISSEDVNIRDTNALGDYTVRIINEQGVLVAPTEKGQQLLLGSKFVSHRTAIRIHLQEEIKREISLRGIYDLQSGGVYTITVERRIATQDGKGLEEMRSNAVNVKIDG